MNATDLISFVPLHDDRGRTVALYYPDVNTIVIGKGGVLLSFPLANAAMKAAERTPIKAQVKINKTFAKR